MTINITLKSRDGFILEIPIEKDYEVFGELECNELKRDIMDYISLHPDYMYYGYEIIEIKLNP